MPTIARELNARPARRGMPADVRVYRTKASNSYAITSGGVETEDLANDRVRALRRFGIVPDAFAQPDRGWERAEIRF